HLHATATEVSVFRLLTGVPLYFGFVFGLMRDQWNPLGLRDRGFFLIFAPLAAVVFFWMAAVPVTYYGLLIGMLFAMVAFRFVSAAYQGLIALVGQEQLMSGRLSVLWNIIAALPGIGGTLASGYISDYLAPQQTFVLVAALTLGIAAL